MKRRLIALVLGAASLAWATEKYTVLVIPDSVALGMSLGTIQSIRHSAARLDGLVGSRNVNATTLTEIIDNGVPVVFYYYHFIDDELRAVTYGIGHYGKRDEQTIRDIHHALAADLVKLSDEAILRLNEAMEQIPTNAEVWEDSLSGMHVCFVDATDQLTVVTFDPAYFQMEDFFMTPDEMPKIAPALETVRKIMDELKEQEK